MVGQHKVGPPTTSVIKFCSKQFQEHDHKTSNVGWDPFDFKESTNSKQT